MEYVEKNLLLQVKRTTFSGKLSKITFVLFLFFIIFGTKLPLQEKSNDVADLETSNVVNQIAFTTLFLTSFVTLVSKRKELAEILWKEKFMTLFLLWCFLSISWSHFSLVSFKRFFQILTAFSVILSILIYSDSQEQILKYMRMMLSIFIFISIIAVFTAPMATDRNGAWQGISASKNHLGQSSVTAALVFLFSMKGARWYQKIILLFLMLAAVILLFGSKSSTSAVTFVIVLGIWGVLFLDEFFRKIKAGKTFSTIVITGGILLIASIVFLAPDLLKFMFNSIGEDTSFTGRTDLWADIGLEINKHPMLGAGYQGYWVLTNNDVLLLYNKYIWIPQQAHNGYIDIINEVGYIGFGIFLIMLISYFIHLFMLKQSEFWKWIIIAVLLINMQESTIFRPGITTGTFFIFAYLSLFAELSKKEREQKYVTGI